MQHIIQVLNTEYAESRSTGATLTIPLLRWFSSVLAALVCSVSQRGFELVQNWNIGARGVERRGGGRRGAAGGQAREGRNEDRRRRVAGGRGLHRRGRRQAVSGMVRAVPPPQNQHQRHRTRTVQPNQRPPRNPKPSQDQPPPSQALGKATQRATAGKLIASGAALRLLSRPFHTKLLNGNTVESWLNRFITAVSRGQIGRAHV